MIAVESSSARPASEHDETDDRQSGWRQSVQRCIPGADILSDLRYRYRGLERSLARIPPARMLTTIPRTGGFAYRTLVRRRATDTRTGLPPARLTPTLLANVAMDEAIIAMAVGPDRLPHRADYERVSLELAEALEMYEEAGWIADPASYHRTPPPLERVQTKTGWAHRMRYERIMFMSEYEPREGEPGRDRWLDFHTNRTASAWVLRHPDDETSPRPWLVCIHGFGMGQAFMDFPAFHAAHLYHDLGLNLIGPVLPLHGHRRVGKFGGDQLLSFDLLNSVHGLAQALWDIRRVLSWVRSQPGGDRVGAYGVSLGAYAVSLLASFEPNLDAVIAGIPVSDFPALYAAQSPPVIRERSVEAGILGGPAELVHRVVSPLAMEPVVPHEARFIFAGLADRLSHPRQAHDLWRHWGEPRLRWYPGNHIAYLWSNRVSAFIDEVLVGHGLASRARQSTHLARIPADDPDPL